MSDFNNYPITKILTPEHLQGFDRRASRSIYDSVVFAQLQDKVLTINKVPPWVATAKKEIGTAEVVGAKHNPRILEYFKSSKFWGTDDSGGSNAWCGSFMAWVMEQHNYKPPKAAYRAKSWINFGKKINEPIIGAIGIKSRTGGGHVAMILGKSKDGKQYYMLGGNQGDTVCVKTYSKNVWTDWVVPPGFDTKGYELPVYTGKAGKSGKES